MSDISRLRRLDRDVGLIGSIYDAAPIGVAVWTVEGRLVHANPVCCQLLGWSAEDLTDRALVDFTRQEASSEVMAGVQDLWAGRRNHLDVWRRTIPTAGR